MAKTFVCGLILEGRLCVVLGDDEEAHEKASALLEKGGRVRIVGENLSGPEWEELKKNGAELVVKKPEVMDVQDAYLAMFSDKNDAAMAKDLRAFCDKHKILLCAIDQPAFCDLVNVSQYKRGHLILGVSSEGYAPSVAKKIRLGLEESLKDVPLEDFMDYLATERRRLEKEIPDKAERRKRLIALAKDFSFSATIELPDWKSS